MTLAQRQHWKRSNPWSLEVRKVDPLAFVPGLILGVGNSNDAFVGMAMSEAAKRFDSLQMQGNVSSGGRQEAVSNAAKTALQLISQAGGASGGKSGSGGQGGILGNLLGGQGGGPVQGLLGNIL
jgi:hypothetical protein